ncbi:hypothetical protein ASG31_03545 [Chryseobacterium sp. Leaf404]|uniref:hypothetical protein n=1 Tax=unclassified Chryseobacterium TaxID=2593645 RepID=UPI0006F80EFB|nr:MULTISPECIES: hypothetical protein [unclassified Chryseobacterium]KQT22411.1 hypothetical protein ASG31_03545 [Chryseobacterium sp. Leaf404]
MKKHLLKMQNIFVLLFCFGFLNAQQSLKMPKDALFYMEINGKQLNNKVNWEKLNPFFKELSKNDDKKTALWNDYSKTGIKYDATQYHYASANDSVYAYTTYFTLDNNVKFNEFIGSVKRKGQEVIKKSNYEYVDIDDNVFVAWNDKKAVLKVMNYDKPYSYDIYADSAVSVVDSAMAAVDSVYVGEPEEAAEEIPFDYKEEIKYLKEEITYIKQNIKDSNAEILKLQKDIKYLEKHKKYPEEKPVKEAIRDTTYTETAEEEVPPPPPVGPRKHEDGEEEEEEQDMEYDYEAEAKIDSAYHKEMDSLNIEKFKIIKKLAEEDFTRFFNSNLELEVSKDVLSFRDAKSDIFIHTDYAKIFGLQTYKSIYREFGLDQMLGKIYNSNSSYNLYFDDDKVRLVNNYQHKNTDINNSFAALYKGKKNKKLNALINDKSIGYYAMNLNGYKYFDLIYTLFDNSGDGEYQKEIKLMMETVKIVLDEEAISKIAPGNGIFVLNELKSKKVDYTEFEYDDDYNEKEIKKTKDVMVPDFTFAFATENEKYWNRIFDMLLTNKETSKNFIKEGNFYRFKEGNSQGAVDQFYFTVKDGIVYLTTSKENINPKTQSDISKNWMKDSAKYAVSGRLNIQKLLIGLDQEFKDSSDIKLLNLMKKNAGELNYRSEVKGNSIQTEIHYNIKTSAENSLMYFFDLADEIYKITEADKKDQTL